MMKNVSSAQKVARHTNRISGQRGRAGPIGLAIAPPGYGIDMVDHDLATGALPSVAWSVGHEPIQKKSANGTGLPDTLKNGIETLSGLAMQDVKVHYNSPKPAQLQALAYTQGSDIYVGRGQEKHLPHEAWHVVQQKQGQVRPMRYGQRQPINDDRTLEREAEVMGSRALRSSSGQPTPLSDKGVDQKTVTQYRTSVVQLYPNLAQRNDGEIREQEWGTGDGMVAFSHFDSCLGVVGRNGNQLTGVHLVYIDGNQPPNYLTGRAQTPIMATTVQAIVQALFGHTEARLVGDVTGWDRNASAFMALLRNNLNNVQTGRDSEHGDWIVTYDNGNWDYFG